MKITNQFGLPKPIVDAVTRDYEYTPKRYSTTTVLKGTREAILQRRHADEITQDVADMVWAVFGTAVHSLLEQSQETDTQIKENKLTVDMGNGYTLSGIFDLYDDATGTVTDYKTASVWKVTFNEWDDYRKQTLIYCYMLRDIGFDAHRGEIVAFLKDHSHTKAAHDSSYPQFPLYRIGWDFTDDDFAAIDKELHDKFDQLAKAEQLSDDQLPLCTPEERWRKDDKWAVMQKGRKRAVKLHDSEEAATKHAEELNESTGKKHYVEYRPGEDTKCLNYCSACAFCNYYKDNYLKENH